MDIENITFDDMRKIDSYKPEIKHDNIDIDKLFDEWIKAAAPKSFRDIFTAGFRLGAASK